MYPSSMHAHILRNMVKTLAWFHDTTSNDFIDRTFLQSNAAEHTCVAIFFLRCPTELNMLQESSNTGQNSQTSNKESKTN